MILYHGSEFIIDKPEYGKGSPHNDYGLGFYCTEHIELAREWACTNEHGGYANRYSLDPVGLKVIKLTDGHHNILNWLAILLENRQFKINSDIKASARQYLLDNFLPDYKDCDVMIGYRADDSYFQFANAFIGNALSLQRLSKAMYLGNLSEQVCLRSKNAFGQVIFEGSEPVLQDEYFPKRKNRDDEARAAYKTEIAAAADPLNETFVMDIIRQEWRGDDARLQ